MSASKDRPAFAWEHCDVTGNLSRGVTIAQFAPSTNTTVLGVEPNFPVESLDSGLTWNPIPRAGLPPGEILTSVTFGPKGIYVGGSGGLYFRSWARHKNTSEERTPDWVNQADMWSITTFAERDIASPGNRILAGLGASNYNLPSTALAYTDDPSHGWASPPGYPIMSPTAMPVGIVSTGQYVLVGSAGNGAYFSSGQNFNFKYIGLTNQSITSVATIQHPTAGWYNFAGTRTSGLLRATYNNPVFASIAPPNINPGGGTVNIYAINTCLFAAFEGIGVYLNQNCGDPASWQAISNGLPVGSSIRKFGKVGNYLLASFLLPNGKALLYRLNLSFLNLDLPNKSDFTEKI